MDVSKRSCHTESEQAADPEFCCCEYRNVKGERTHILAFCCDCQELDEIAERCLCLRSLPPELVDDAYTTLGDRLRVPWCGGAIRVQPVTLLAPIAIPVSLVIAAVSFKLSITVMLLSPIWLFIFYLKVLRYQRRSKFYLSWTVSSYAWLLYVFELVVMSYREILLWENVFFVLGVALTSYNFYKVKTSMNLGEGSNVSGASRCGKCGTQQHAVTEHCNTCQHCVMGRDHHCVWIDCCIGASNRRNFVAMLLCLVLSTSYACHLTLCVVCTPTMLLVAGSSHVLYPRYCHFVFADFQSALCFVTVMYAIFLTSLASLACLHQLFLVSLGVTWIERRRGSKQTRRLSAREIIRNLQRFICARSSLSSKSMEFI